MKSTNKKIQILMKGIAILIMLMMTLTPIVYATSSLDDSNLEGSWLDKLLYGTIGSTKKEIEEYFKSGKTTLYISNETQLRALAEYVNDGNNCDGKNVVLLNDIRVDVSQEWIPIGKEGKPFSGSFDGQNYTISGINFNRNNKLYSEITNVGLFGYVTKGSANSTIKNIIIADSHFNIPYNLTSDILEISTDLSDENIPINVSYSALGGVVGYNYKATIENCIINNDVTILGMKNVGGIVGKNESGLVKNCKNNGSINGFDSVGGIVGFNYGDESVNKSSTKLNFSGENVAKVTNSKNLGAIYSLYGTAGGIIGNQEHSSIVQACSNNAKISIATENISIYVSGQKYTLNPQNAGGIVGRSSASFTNDNTYYSIIDGCINNGEIIGYVDIGGIAGQLSGNSAGYDIMRSCINNSLNIKSTKEEAPEKEWGYLAGEVWGYIQDESSENAKGFMVNNFIKGKEDLTKDSEHTEIVKQSYGRLKESKYYESNTKVTSSDENIITFYPVMVESNITNKEEQIQEGLTVYVNNNTTTYNYNRSTDNFEMPDNEELKELFDTSTGTFVTYTIYKNNNKINGSAYYKEGDTIKITVKFNKYLAETYGPLTKITTAPTLTLNNEKEMTPGTINVSSSNYTTTIDYTYKVQAEDNMTITSLNLAKNGRIYAISDGEYSTNHPEITTSEISTNMKEMYIDTVKPTIYTKVYVKNALETGKYTTGKEILFEITTSEPITGKCVTPNIKVSFSKSGVGKYNYTKENESVGIAKCENAKINVDGTTTWTYKYQIQTGDEGEVQLEYISGVIADLAGNTTNIKDLYTPQDSNRGNVSGTSWNNNLGATYEFYKNSVAEENKVNSQTYFTKDDDLIVLVKFDKVLYVHYGLSDGKNTNVRLDNSNRDRAPSLYLNGSTAIKNTSIDEITVTNHVDTTETQEGKNGTTTITYRFDIDTYKINELTEIKSIDLKNENNTNTVQINGTTAATNGLIAFSEKWYDTYKSEDLNQYQTISDNAISSKTDIPDIILDPVGVSNNINQYEIYADTTLPTVQITAEKVDGENIYGITNNITNANTIRYTFTWSEEVVGFTTEDITVNNGTKGILSDGFQEIDGTYTYTMDVTTNIEKGNVGEIQVIIEQNACQDMVGHENVKAESTIRVDKQAPILISLEAYTNSNIQINEAVDTVKEYYKDGDKITIIATFNENIEDKTTIAPKLTLQFSESGNAKSKVSEGVIEGNKITYTYTVTSGDEGILTVKGFNGKVLDAAENETIVTKRTLDGDTIITDTTAPKLTGITAIAPNFEYDELLTNPKDIKRYGIQSKTRENNTIVIITTYSEDVFNLNSNILNGIDDNNKPILKLKFGNSDERTATFNKVEGNKIYYTYNITSGDNGDLANINITGNVYDKAGNNLNLTTSSTLPSLEEYEESIVKENKIERITADTTKPSFTITASAINKDENGNTIQSGNFYRKGSIITIIASTNEYSYKNNNKNLELFTNSTAPKLNIGFETNGTGTGECTNVEYKDNKTIFTYTYKVQENNNGELNLNIAENQCYDIALNGNNIKTQTVAEITADTVYPVTNWQSWIENEKYGIVDNQNGSWRVTFSEELYEYDINTHTVGSRLSNSNKSSAPILLVSSDNKTPLETVISNIEVIDNKTVITYTYNPYTKNLGAYGIKFASISDRAGNLFNYKDQEAPILSNIKVTDPVTGTYKAGQKITIVVTFNEKVTGTAPVLKLKFGETSAKGSVSTGEIVNNTITYTYTITDGDNGKLAIESYTGTGLTDLYDNVWVAPTNVTLEGNQITADTIAPTVVITSDVERTNKETITYTFTWSEPVKDFTIGDVEVANGSKGKWTSVSSTVYTLEVDVTGEGRQIIKVNANVCTDIAGNPNSERVTYNKVIVDTIAPEIRAKINGGSYAINTDTNKSTIKEIVVVNEELSKFEYVWSTETSQPTTGWQTVNVNTIEVNGDIPLTTQVDNEGTYYLYIKITDLAGNTLNKRTKGYEVNKSTITFAPNITQETEENVIVKVEYGNALIKNRKAGIQGKTQSADSTIVILSENGTVYAEATDIAGNKVYNTIEITNIKKSSQNDTNTDIDIVFEDLTTIQKNGEKYVKVSPEYTTQQLTEKINQKTLNGKTPEYNNLTTDNKLKTGSTITIDGTTKYIIIVNGDVNCDGKVEFLSDIVMINNYRIGQNRNLNTIQLLAGDINNSGAIEFIPDIVAMNNYRLGRVSVL